MSDTTTEDTQNANEVPASETEKLVDRLRDIKVAMVADRESLEEVSEYVSLFTGQEYIIAWTVYGMALNTVALMLRRAQHADETKGS